MKKPTKHKRLTIIIIVATIVGIAALLTASLLKSYRQKSSTKQQVSAIKQQDIDSINAAFKDSAISSITDFHQVNSLDNKPLNSINDICVNHGMRHKDNEKWNNRCKYQLTYFYSTSIGNDPELYQHFLKVGESLKSKGWSPQSDTEFRKNNMLFSIINLSNFSNPNLLGGIQSGISDDANKLENFQCEGLARSYFNPVTFKHQECQNLSAILQNVPDNTKRLIVVQVTKLYLED